jgi:hypothetical protein
VKYPGVGYFVIGLGAAIDAAFDLTGHPKARRALAWTELVDAVSGRRRFNTTLKCLPSRPRPTRCALPS